MKLVIVTQRKENYGAHDWDGKGECPQYWKFKGGETYVLENFEWTSVDGLNKVVDFAIAQIESADDYFEEYVVSWEICDDAEIAWDSWDAPTYIKLYDDHITCVKVQTRQQAGYSEEVVEQRRYFKLKGGEQYDHSCYLQLTDGEFYKYDRAIEVIRQMRGEAA